MRLHPLSDILNTANGLLAKGDSFWQTFVCAHCKADQTMEEKNQLFETATCEECGKVTDIKDTGCNLTVHMILK